MDEAVEARTAVAVETSDDGGATGLMRRSVLVVVESALANVLGSADTRHAVRAAAETFGDALAAHASAGARSHARRARPIAVDASPARTADDRTCRARAFRRMAGV